jgi:hypothetical protein
MAVGTAVDIQKAKLYSQIQNPCPAAAGRLAKSFKLRIAEGGLRIFLDPFNLKLLKSQIPNP